MGAHQGCGGPGMLFSEMGKSYSPAWLHFLPHRREGRLKSGRCGGPVLFSRAWGWRWGLPRLLSSKESEEGAADRASRLSNPHPSSHGSICGNSWEEGPGPGIIGVRGGGEAYSTRQGGGEGRQQVLQAALRAGPQGGGFVASLTTTPRRSLCRRLRVCSSSEKWCAVPRGRKDTRAPEAIRTARCLAGCKRRELCSDRLP